MYTNKIFSNADTKTEVIYMAKAGMRRPDPKQPHGTESNHKTHFTKNTVPPVPELQGKSKHGKKENPTV